MSNYAQFIKQFLEGYPIYKTKIKNPNPEQGVFPFMDMWGTEDFDTVERLKDLEDFIALNNSLIKRKGNDEGNVMVQELKKQINDYQLEYEALSKFADEQGIQKTYAKVA